MNNVELAKILRNIAAILQMKGVEWKPQAYRRAARSLDALQEDVAEVYRRSGLKGLEEIPGVGEALAKKIEQYLTEGRIKEYEELQKTIPKPVVEMMKVPGMGPKRAKLLYEKLNIKNIKELEQAAKHHKLQALRSFKQKIEENILKGIEVLRTTKERTPIEEVLPIADAILKKLKSLRGVKHAYVGGSVRRKEPTVGDMDFLVTTKNHPAVIEMFVNMPQVKDVLAKGETKAAVRLKNGMQSDLRVVPEESFAAALQYFTGNKDHNVKLRIIAIKKGYKLSVYGLFDRKTGRRIPCKTEHELYKKLGLRYIRPENRKNRGEIEKAMIRGYATKL